MRYLSTNILSAADSVNQTSQIIDCNQLVSASFHTFFGDITAAGTIKLQASNDPKTNEGIPSPFIPTNWVDIPNQSATVTAGSSSLLSIPQMTYRWIRALYTVSSSLAQTIAPIADTGVIQVQTVTAKADVAGSLNSKYFLLSSVNLISKARKDFYVWFNDGAGVDPAIAGRTGIQIVYSDGDSANTIASDIRTALNALTNDFVATGSNAAVIITNTAQGLVPAASDGIAATTFTFANTTPGVASNLNNHYFFLNNALNAHKYYVWFNVSGIGTDPAPAGLTGIEVDFAAHASAATIGTAMATAIAAVSSSNDFTATGTTTVTVTNKTAGGSTPASDFNSGFAFAVTAGGSSTLNINLFALSV